MWKKKNFRAGSVVEVGEKEIKVTLFSKDLPAACMAKGCSACKSYSPEIVREYAKSDFVNDVSVGDIVKVESWYINDGFAATALFMTPILFSAISYHVAVVSGISQESIWAVLIVIFGAIFGFLLVVFFDRVFRKFNPTKIYKE